MRSEKTYKEIILGIPMTIVLLPVQPNNYRLSYFWEDYHVVGYSFVTTANFVKAIRNVLGEESIVGAEGGFFNTKTDRSVGDFVRGNSIKI